MFRFRFGHHKGWTLSVSVLICLVMASEAYATKNYRLSSGEVLSDPTRPYNWQTKKRSKTSPNHFKLNYILNADTRKLAMINGQKVTEGDYVSGARVVRIQEGAVTLSVNGKQKVLRINKHRGIKQTN